MYLEPVCIEQGERISTPTDRLLNGLQNAERYGTVHNCSENFCEIRITLHVRLLGV